jgi:REP element-mobilizing transposase RayT
MRWRHVVISTHNSWLPGDPRGFRAKNHKIHSSGDYKNPPPPGEPAGLYAFSKNISGAPVVIPPDLRRVVGKSILAKLNKLHFRTLAMAVAGMHVHFLAELPADIKKVRHVVGQCKAVSSHQIRDRLPGRVWGHGGSFKPVDTPEYQQHVYQYILDQEDAWIWCYKDGVPDEEPRRLEDSPSGLNPHNSQAPGRTQ